MSLPALPPEGVSDEEILDYLRQLRTADLVTTRATGYHFESGFTGLRELASAASATAWGTNGLDPTVFPSIAAVENDLVAAAKEVHGGGPAVVGTVTSGGTESCMLPVLEARERWRRTHGRDQRPTMLLPLTAHPAFRKAAHIFDVDIVPISIGADFRVDAAEMIAAMADDRVCLVVVSAPSYAHGVIDPVAEVAAAALERDIPCHLDMCIGGWALPFILAAEDRPMVGMDTPGVTSLSADLHKYGWAPKGISVLLHANQDLRMEHWFADAGWPGYPVVNPTLLGSRSAAPASAAWAILHRLGRSGLRELALESRRGALALAERLSEVDGIGPVVVPDATLVAVVSESPEVDVRVVADEMGIRGWPMQIQPARAGGPTTMHLTITPAVTGQLDDLIAALQESVAAARDFGRSDPDPQLAAAAASLDPAALNDEALSGLLQLAGMEGGDGSFALPERMAETNALLEAAPPELVEWMLKGALARVLTPRQ